MGFLRKYTFVIFIALSVTITLFLGEDRKNMLLIALMSLTPILLVFAGVKFDKNIKLLFVFLVAISLINLRHIEAVRVTSYFYTICFCTTFCFLYNSVNRGYFKLDQTIKMLSLLIYAYTAVLILQQLCVAFNISPIINQGPVYEESKWKLCSLAPEPSHAVRYMFFFMYSYLELKEIKLGRKYIFRDFRKDKIIWFCYFWLMMTSFSTTGFLLTLFIFTKFIKTKNILQWAMLIALIVLLMNILFVDNNAYQRVTTFIDVMASFDIEKINSADHSAAHRVLPFFVLLQYWDIFSIDFWIGHGMDAGKMLCQQIMAYISNDYSYIDKDVNIGGLFAFFIDYGFIASVLLIAFFLNVLKHIKNKLLVIIWFAIIMVASLNTQLLWISLVLMYLVSYFTNKKAHRLIKNCNG